MRTDVLVYLAGPITPKNGFTIEENVSVGVKTFLSLIDNGIPAYSPQMIAAFPSAFHIEWGIWMELDKLIIAHCTHMLMLPNWRDSKGACEERMFAEKIQLRICESVAELLDAINEA
jgi:hypothetical protein